jgi:hypothetical protein
MEAGSGSRIDKSARIHADPDIDPDPKHLSQLTLIPLLRMQRECPLNEDRRKLSQKKAGLS